MSDIGLDALFANGDDPLWRGAVKEATGNVADDGTADAYRALFGSELGQIVLADMYKRYVNVTRAVPGGGPEHAFYREGMAQVVFEIVNYLEGE